MKKIWIRNIVLVGSLAFSMGLAAQTSLTSGLEQGKPLKIRYRSKIFKGPVKSVLIRDKTTGKSALLAIPLINAEQGLYEATFTLPFDYTSETTDTDTKKSQLEVFPVKTTEETLARSLDPSKAHSIQLQTRQQEQQRLDFELAEAQKREQLEKKAQALSAQERERKQKEASRLAEEALANYDSKNYAKASQLFQSAINEDPQNNKYYYQYGVSLFQQQEYQKSLVALSMADQGDFSEADKRYFMGMNYFRLNETDKALKYFIEVRESDNESLSPTAAFYAGVIQFSLGQYTEAKNSFGYVLDKSKDPKIDLSAESYLDKIDAIEQFNSGFKDKWLFRLFAGPIFDSNILNASEVNTPTDKAGLRGLFGASLERRLLYDYHKEWSLLANFSDMYSTNTSLSPVDDIQNEDPLVFGISSPWKWKSEILGKPATLQLTPGFETLLLNADGEADRERTTQSLYLRADYSTSHTPTWAGSYGLEYRSDQSFLESAPEDDQSAGKILLSTSQIFIQDTKLEKYYILDSSFAVNNAEGVNQRYQQLRLAFTYTQAWRWKTQMAYQADLTWSAYPEHLESRQDSGYGISVSGSKNLSERISVGLSLGYNQNSSNIEVFNYDKISVSNIYTYSGAF